MSEERAHLRRLRGARTSARPDARSRLHAGLRVEVWQIGRELLNFNSAPTARAAPSRGATCAPSASSDGGARALHVDDAGASPPVECSTLERCAPGRRNVASARYTEKQIPSVCFPFRDVHRNSGHSCLALDHQRCVSGILAPLLPSPSLSPLFYLLRPFGEPSSTTLPSISVVTPLQRESQEIEDGLAPAIMRMAAEPVEESPLGVMQTELGGQQVRLCIAFYTSWGHLVTFFSSLRLTPTPETSLSVLCSISASHRPRRTRYHSSR